jgi:hypothetical protein
VDTATEIVLSIAIRPANLTRDRLSCLARTFREKYRDRRKITVFVFTSDSAARQYSGPELVETIPARRAIVRQMHATYYFDADKHVDSITLMPLGTDTGGPFDMQFDLTVATWSPCRFEINGRCLVALQDIRYPNDLLTAKTSGSVTMTARIARDGAVSHVQIAKIEGSDGAASARLAQEAKSNLKTWRVEAGSREDAIRITYNYVIDPSLPTSGELGADVTLSLPSGVTIRGRSPQ